MLDGLGAYCEKALAEHGCPSVSVAVVERGEVVLAEAHGWADVAAQRPATPGTAYALASVTKAFTATALCLAADEGLLDLDAPVPGDFRHRAPTPRQLLQHRGGFAAHYDFHYGGGARPIDSGRYSVQFREPDTAFEYANLGYRLATQVLEAATGQPLDRYLRERVFEPLGLTDCHLGPEYPGPAPSAQRYTPDGRPYPVCDSGHPGAGAGWGTASQVALFAQARARLLAPGTMAALEQAVPLTEHVGYGLGWIVSQGPGLVVQSHGGGMGGVAAMLVAVPELELSVAVLCNSTNKAARDAIVGYVLRALVPGFRPEQLDPTRPEPPHPVRLPEREWTGLISAPEGEIPVAVRTLADSRIEVRLAGGAPDTVSATASASWDLRASLPLQLPTADARVNSPVLGLELRAEDGRLTGAARAYKDGDREGWLGNFLSHPCELR